MSRPTTFGDLLTNRYETVPYRTVPLGRGAVNLEVETGEQWRVLSDEETQQLIVNQIGGSITEREIPRYIGEIQNVS